MSVQCQECCAFLNLSMLLRTRIEHIPHGCRPRTTAWKNCPVFYAWIDDQGDTNTLNYDVHLRTIGFGRAHNLDFFQIDCRQENPFKSMLNWNVKFQSGCSYGTQQLLHL